MKDETAGVQLREGQRDMTVPNADRLREIASLVEAVIDTMAVVQERDIEAAADVRRIADALDSLDENRQRIAKLEDQVKTLEVRFENLAQSYQDLLYQQNQAIQQHSTRVF